MLYLPSLTPEAESVALLRPAYRALLVLAKSDTDPRSVSRRRLLDKILHDGVFAGFHHASEYISVTEVLMDATAEVVKTLTIYSAKHLQVSPGIQTRSHALPNKIILAPEHSAHDLFGDDRSLRDCLWPCDPRGRESAQRLHCPLLATHDRR